jgi:hypothetical protein
MKTIPIDMHMPHRQCISCSAGATSDGYLWRPLPLNLYTRHTQDWQGSLPEHLLKALYRGDARRHGICACHKNPEEYRSFGPNDCLR